MRRRRVTRIGLSSPLGRWMERRIVAAVPFADNGKPMRWHRRARPAAWPKGEGCWRGRWQDGCRTAGMGAAMAAGISAAIGAAIGAGMGAAIGAGMGVAMAPGMAAGMAAAVAATTQLHDAAGRLSIGLEYAPNGVTPMPCQPASCS